MLSQLIESVGSGSWVLMERGGYGGVFLLSFLDRVLLSLVPSEVILPLAGFGVGQGRFSFGLIVWWVTFGNLLGDLILYAVSAVGGRRLLEKYGRYIFISKHELDHTDKLFARHGGKLVIGGRLLPIVRTFIAIPAGIARMSLRKFIGYTIIGSLPYNVLLLYLGFKSGQNWDIIKTMLVQGETLIAVGLGIVLGWYLYRHLKKRRHLTH